jgi:hypothetical protein
VESRREWISCLYLYRLREDHPLIESLRVVSSSLRKAGVEPLFFVTPIDHETGTAWYGPDFRPRVSANVAVIQDVLSDCGARVIDMSFDLGRDAFAYSTIPNEHLKEYGRRHVARRLAEAIRRSGSGFGRWSIPGH